MKRTTLLILVAIALACSSTESWKARVRSLQPVESRQLGEAVLDNLEARVEEVLGQMSHPASLEEVAIARQKVREGLRNSLGLDRFPWPPRLNAQTVGILEMGDYKIEKIVYESLPGVQVPAHLYVSNQLVDPAPTIVFYPGHWMSDSKTRPDFQTFCINMARMGAVVFTFDPFGQGERGVSWRDHRRTSALLVGISQQGIAAYETQCAIEYLLSRSEVDSRRIGITGASGGGYNTWITGVIDDRISVAVPVVGTSDFLEQIQVCRELDWYGAKEHCHFVPNLLHLANNHEMLAAIFPRPLLIVATSEDQSFPIRGVRDVFRYGQRLYRDLRSPDRVAFFEDQAEGHGYQRSKREAAYGWFSKWLLDNGDGTAILEPETHTRPADDPDLRCFPEGENQPAGPGVVAFIEELAKRPDSGEPSLPALAGLLGPLELSDVAPLQIDSSETHRLEVKVAGSVLVPAFLHIPEGYEGLLFALDDDGKEALLDEPLITQAVNRRWAVCGIDPRGIGELRVQEMGWVSAVSLLLGENFVWKQAGDLRAVIDSLSQNPAFREKPIVVYGRGDNAGLIVFYLLAQYRAMGRGPVDSVVVKDCFVSYRHFIYRKDSMMRSFRLSDIEDDSRDFLDHEIPFQYFVFGALDIFDLPDILRESSVTGTIVQPINGDWKPVPLEEVVDLLPQNFQVVHDFNPGELLSEFEELKSTP